MQLPTLAALEAAAAALRPHLTQTPAIAWPLLDARAGASLWVKHENHLPTGAFKVRGGLIHLARLAAEKSAPNGIIGATRGNHGQSLAFAGRAYGIPVTIVVPHGNSPEKNAAMRAYGARLIEHGDDFDAALAHAQSLATTENLRFAPSFHEDLVLGVATWALELFRAAPPLDALYVPIGMGSGICGAIAARDALGLETQIVGVQSAAFPAYARAFATGTLATTPPAATSLADGLAVRTPHPDALAIIRAGAARIVTVTDDQIATAIRAFWTDTHNLAEGAGAAALAAILAEPDLTHGRRIGLPLCGGNIDLEKFRHDIV